MPKFDVVVGNPPYQRGLHMKFLDIACKTSTKYVVFIQPAIWILSSGEKSNYTNIVKKISNHIIEIDLLNGIPIFKVAIGIPLSVTLINKNLKTNTSIILNDKFNNKQLILDKLSLINIWGNYDIFPIMKEKFKNISSINNLRICKNRRNNNKKYFVSVAQSRGNINTSSINKIFCDDFYTFIPKDYIELGYGPLTYIPEKWNSQKQRNWYGFDTIEESNNFITYIKSKFAMFALALNKFNMAIQEKESEGVPWLDFTQEWTDEKLYKHFNLTQEEINFIETNIPNYYND